MNKYTKLSNPTSCVLALTACFVFPSGATGQGEIQEIVKKANEFELAADYAKAVEQYDLAIDLAEMRDRYNLSMRRGEAHFMNADMKAAVADFDIAIKENARSKPYNWQRGLALYYAGEFKLGQEQFETHQTVNSGDVENAVWHFLCRARQEDQGFKKAQESIYPFRGDTRVPMKEVHAMFAGTGSVDDVLAAAESDSAEIRKRRLYYAHLYIGLYLEAEGKPLKSLEQMQKAKEFSPFEANQLMGRVADVHVKLRSQEKKHSAKE